MKWIKKILKWLLKLAAAFIILSVLTAVIYKYVPPPVTPIMILRVFEGMFEGRWVGIDKDWEAYDNISSNFLRAVIVAEDRKFMRHSGIDWDAVDAAKRYNERHKGKKLRGASTITMQTAKNTFLWHGRNYVRKALEAYFTYMIEFIWGKKRILEIYVNVIEMGDGIYGIEAAAQHYFNKPANKLTKYEAALIASVLPNPRRWNPSKPTSYIKKRASGIASRLGGARLPKD